ncbi:nuclear transport factor 2 family protein [Actinomadura sp. HBU206391]|uniref:nuclear transport factor 2 family protein n=1 Tax=Actinomadura sp. HBU206391 TaxID=2731692 RepID=UPI0016508824|nr:nuclear transport factor 2 family protein [Actinomadura sp. HBU206391]MBC6457339.1 nuclear transport factor 2 family protein [Actinomadura sp. HBU206391]
MQGPGDDLHDRLLDLEGQGWTALSSGTGGDFYRDRLSADAYMVLPIGTLGREASINAMEQAPPWARFLLTETHSTALGGDAAVLTYRALAQRDGEPPYTALISSVYVREDGELKMAIHQQTPLAAG